MHGAVRRALSAVASVAMGLGGFVLGAPVASATPTDGPTIVAPDPFVDVAGNPMLQWSAVSGATKYRVQVSAQSTYSPLLYNVDTYGLHFAPPTDLPIGTIYWRVAAIDSTGVGPFSESQFPKRAAAGPEVLAPVINPNPGGAAQLTYPGDAPMLKWTPLSNVKNYEIWLDDNDTFSTPEKFTTENTSYALTDPVTLGKPFYWQVRGVSATTGVTSAWSATASFIVTWPAATGRPQLLTPRNDPSIEVQDVKFTWTPVVGAKAYQIQVSPNGDWANNVIDDQRVKGTQYSPTQTYNNDSYYWRVRAVDTGATTAGEHFGDWSDPSQFTRAWTDKPSLQSPINDTTVTEPLMRFEWTGVSKAAYYQVQVSTDPSFPATIATYTCYTYHTTLTPHVIEANVSATPVMPSGSADCKFAPSRGLRYYWHVRGIDTPGSVTPALAINGVWSDTEAFFAYPGTVAMVSPMAGEPVSAPVLRWQPLGSYNKYQVTVIRADGKTVVDTTYSTSWSPTSANNLGVGDFQWFVQGVGWDGVLTPVQGQYGAFSIVNPSGTGTVATAYPTDPAAPMSNMPALTWAPVTGASFYKVFYAPAGSDTFFALTDSTEKPPYAAYTYTGEPLAPGDYQWFVRAYNASALEITSLLSLGSFTIAVQPFVHQTLPADCTLESCGAPVVDTPELVWDPMPGTYGYRVYLAKDVNFTNVVRKYFTQYTHLTPRESLPDSQAGESYYWYVQACRSPGSCGPLPQEASEADRTNVRAFRKRSPEPVLRTPTNQTMTSLTDQVAFDWDDYFATEPRSAGARQYKIEVASDPAFNTSVDNATVDQSHYAPWSKVYPDGVYYWRVQAIDGSGLPLTRSDNNDNGPTDPWTFQKISATPTLSAVTTDGGYPTLKWSPMAYAGSYQVEIYRDVNSTYPLVNRVLAATSRLASFTPTAPLPAGAYSWRVRKLDNDGNGGPWATSAAAGRNFTLTASAVTLIAPANDANERDNDLVFTWKPVVGAASYRFESSTSSSFSGTLFEQQTTVMTTWVPTTRLYADNTNYYWRVRVLDSAGNSLAVSSGWHFYKDAKAPTATGVSPTSNVSLAGPVTVTFAENVKGISASTVKVKLAGTSTYVSGSTTPSSTTLTPSASWTPTSPLVPGQKYVLEATSGITDKAGNPLVFYSSPTIRAALVTDSSSPAIAQYWDVDTSSYASGGSYSTSAVTGGTATFSFTGTQVSLIGLKGVYGGYGDVYLDGVKKATVNFYASSTAWKQTLWSTSGLTSAKHTVQVKVLGTKYSSSKGTEVYVDAFDVNGARNEGTSSLVKYTFRKVSTTSALGSSYDIERYLTDAGGRPEWRMTFRGTGVDWFATRLPSGGQADVYIDNVYKATINLYASSAAYKVKVYYSPTLTDAVHTVRVICKGTKGTTSATATDVTLDYFAVR